MAVYAPGTKWTVFQAGKPLVTTPKDGDIPSLALLSSSQIKSLLGDEIVFGQGENPKDSSESSNESVLESCRFRGPPVVFLGLHEPEGTQALPSSEFRTPERTEDIPGVPYLSVDLSGIPANQIETLLREAVDDDNNILSFEEPRSITQKFNMFEAAVFAEARSMLDWNMRNKFCPGCGSRTYSLWGGWKLSCTSVLPWANNVDREPCLTKTGLHNFHHPRTDPVIITAVLDEKGERILLGRNRKFPSGFYSVLAGFCEPGESFEDAVKREIWEESGIRVYNVKYHSSQPWPYPANLMVGCFASADSSQIIRTDLDNELIDCVLVEARWFTRAEVAAALAHPQGTVIRQAEYKRFDNDDDQGGHVEPNIPPFRVPPRTAIAGVLITDWVAGKLGTTGGETVNNVKGNL
ncbi:hypothetical protein Clacol_003895 [Clathrus columnatus]|uniref:NAD(+) diphosphatase n=1 Tax=Clathrus columnatus TaxID=1419009 RepID=A0AAV5A9H3_9AGAM|nr:hypothetical protein Clacol_003895 [Clathrus columnatus]